MQLKLLIDGAAAFSEIRALIREATHSIAIHMFIWRDDEIGRLLAGELLEAAERGVRIQIVKDRYGVICESCEESRASFFHGSLSLRERISVFSLTLFYNRDQLFQKGKRPGKRLMESLRAHPNVSVTDENRYDHSKYWIFDGRILLLGGINIEDKENGADRQGRVYRDYMVELRGEEAVRIFTGRNPDEKGMFARNQKRPARRFELEERMLSLIEGAEQSLTILMAYFTPMPRFLAAIRRALARGVKVRILVPGRANFTDASNKDTLTRLLSWQEAGLSLYLSDKMVHAKLLMSEKLLTVGSCNITKKAFGQLDELNFFWANNGDAFSCAVRASVEETIRSAVPVTSREELRHSRLFAALEEVLM